MTRQRHKNKATPSKKKVAKKARASTVSDAMDRPPRPAPVKKPEVRLINCEFCGHEFDDACGKYGCPNCHGEWPEPVKESKPGTVLALVAVNPDPARPAVRTFPIIPTFGDAGAKHDMAIVLEDSAWVGYCMMTDGHSVWLEPYEG